MLPYTTPSARANTKDLAYLILKINAFKVLDRLDSLSSSV
jgi:hypothetical protein